MKGIYLCIEVGLTAGLLYVGDRFGTTNMWITIAAIITVHFLIEALCKVYYKFNAPKDDSSEDSGNNSVKNVVYVPRTRHRQEDIDIPVNNEFYEDDSEEETTDTRIRNVVNKKRRVTNK